MRIAILGGGLMGTASAFFLLTHPKAPKSLEVTLIDRGAVGAGATVASFGNVRRQGRDFRQMALAHLSLSLWNRLQTLLDCDVEFRATGHIRAVFHEEGLQDMQTFAKAARAHGLDLELLDQADMRRRFPFFSQDAIAGSFSPHDGSGNPRLVAPAFAQAAARKGLVIRDQTPVVSVARTGSGFQIETPDEVVEADLLLNTAGAWGGQVAAWLGEHTPITPYGPQMGVTEPLAHRILPVIGPSARHEGLFHAFGFCGHGFQLGPGVGAEMAELMLTGQSQTDTRPFHIARFQNEITHVA